ncbi:MAG: hypothetical protein Q8933_02175 [Bacteroidota bacterium]|nr:hypothetical protein [Bacteroidota bacterium]MDP4197060.1 hypothetical protein [Bacteroidota bacterium]
MDRYRDNLIFSWSFTKANQNKNGEVCRLYRIDFDKTMFAVPSKVCILVPK